MRTRAPHACAHCEHVDRDACTVYVFGVDKEIPDTDEECTGRCQSESVETPEPYMAPIPWASMPPQLAKGLVDAQMSAQVIRNDGKSSQYEYPTQAAIARMATAAFAAGRLAIISQGWEAKGGVVYMTFVLIHESGACSPGIHVHMPIVGGRSRGDDKSLTAAITVLRKYLSAMLLNLGWTSESDDIDQRDDRYVQPPYVQPPSPRKVAEPEDNTPMGVLRRRAKKLIKSAIDCGIKGVVTPTDVYQVATGSDGDLGADVTAPELEAIIVFGELAQGDGISRDYRPTYEQIHTWLEDPIFELDGALTDTGLKIKEECSI